MSRELVFLLEERSAQALLESLLPRLLPEGVPHRLIPFEGKQDLEKQLARRIRGYMNPDARFIVLRDQDSAPDCRVIKQRLLTLCADSGRADACLVRVACRELETIYLADLAAVDAALNTKGLAKRQAERKFRSPDVLESPSRELRALTLQRYEKVAGSRAIGKRLDLSNERSATFKHLVAGIRRMAADEATPSP